MKISVVVGGVFFFAALSQLHAADVLRSPQGQDAEQAEAIISRWKEAQGFDRARGEIYPRQAVFRIKVGKGEKEAEVDVRWFGDGRYLLETKHPDLGATMEVVPKPGDLAFFSGEQQGIGSVDKSPLVESLRWEHLSGAKGLKNYVECRRLPDVEEEGRKLQVVAALEIRNWWEKWFFDPTTGVRVRVEVRLGEGPAELAVTTYSNFKQVDEKWEAFSIHHRDPTSEVAIEMTSVTNKAAMAPTDFRIPRELFSQSATAFDILVRYEKACGGDRALYSIASRITRARGEVTTSGLKFSLTMWQKRPDLVLTEIEAEGMGRSRQGFDGFNGWSSSEIQGFRAMRGTELRSFVGGSDLQAVKQLATANPVRKLLGNATVNGRATRVMALGTRDSRSGTYYFDKESGHLLRIESVINSGPDGSLAVTCDFDDFREVDGIVMPFMTVVKNPAVRVVTKIDAVENNVPLDDAMFKAPKEE
jgi:hypothetical protein